MRNEGKDSRNRQRRAMSQNGKRSRGKCQGWAGWLTGLGKYQNERFAILSQEVFEVLASEGLGVSCVEGVKDCVGGFEDGVEGGEARVDEDGRGVVVCCNGGRGSSGGSGCRDGRGLRFCFFPSLLVFLGLDNN